MYYTELLLIQPSLKSIIIKISSLNFFTDLNLLGMPWIKSHTDPGYGIFVAPGPVPQQRGSVVLKLHAHSVAKKRSEFVSQFRDWLSKCQIQNMQRANRKQNIGNYLWYTHKI